VTGASRHGARACAPGSACRNSGARPRAERAKRRRLRGVWRSSLVHHIDQFDSPREEILEDRWLVPVG